MKTLVLFIILSMLVHNSMIAQHYIGLHKAEIVKSMRESGREYLSDNTVVNPVHNYLKYVDRANDQTLLYFLSEDDICTWHKLICDYKLYNEKVEALNQQFVKVDEETWYYRKNHKKYLVTLEKGEWFFTITTRPE